MCIIVAKPQGIKMPSMKTLETCFKHNPDGSGFAYLNKGSVVYKKGFMTFEAFKNALDNLNINKQKATMVFHFRIGTSGTNSKGLTHPFKICDDTNTMKATEGKGSVLFHNGVLYDYNPSRDNKEDVNDTMIFTKTVINKLPKDWEENKAIVGLVKKAIDHNKLAILKPRGLTLIGDFSKEDGVYYSNQSYKEYDSVYTYYPRHNRYGYYDFNSYDDDYDDYYDYAYCDYSIIVNSYKSAYNTDDLIEGDYLFTKEEFKDKYPLTKKTIDTEKGKFIFTYDGKIWEELKYGDELCYEERKHKKGVK